MLSNISFPPYFVASMLTLRIFSMEQGHFGRHRRTVRHHAGTAPVSDLRSEPFVTDVYGVHGVHGVHGVNGVKSYAEKLT